MQLVVNKNKNLRQNEILTAYASYLCYNFAPVLNEKWGKQKKFSQIYLAGIIKIVLKLYFLILVPLRKDDIYSVKSL